MSKMRLWGRYWGVSGVVISLMTAAYRVMPYWEEISPPSNEPLAYALLALLLPLMGYLEGYRGFYKGFSPRVVYRSKELLGQTRGIYQVLAPLYCMGFIGSTVRRKLSLLLVSLCIIGLVIWVKGLPQPWKWVIDLSVGVALLGGVLSVVWLAYRDWSKENHQREQNSF